MKNNFFGILLKIVLYPFLIIQKAAIYFYKFVISPLLPHSCKYTPTCSTYFLQAVNEYGAVKGFIIGTNRIFRCNPFSKGGYDPLKPNIKGKFKWIL